MNRPKRHHYLPQFYLEGFSRNGLLWLFDRKTKQFRKQTPINTAVESGFYTVTTETGQSDDVERLLAMIESGSKPVIDALGERKSISDEEREWLGAFAALMQLRTPGFRRNIDAGREAMLKRITEIRFSNPRVAMAEIERFKAAGGNLGDMTPEQMIEAIRDTDSYRIQFPPSASIQMMLSFAPRIGRVLSAMAWTVAHAPANKVFVTSDESFVLAPPPDYKRNSFYGVGLTTPGAAKLLPLNQRTCLMIGDVQSEPTLRHAEVSAEWVRMVNLSVTANCERFAIAPVEALVRSLVVATAIDRTDPQLRFSVG